jgi:exopolysaccharide biosynthesis polyprenyl glycosylphosphotransferase
VKSQSLGLGISWLPAVGLLLSDLLLWPTIFLSLSQLRGGIIGSAGQIDWTVLIVPALVCAVVLHFAGGYDRSVPMDSLAYSVEHLLGLTMAAVISVLMLYGFVTFNDAVKPSRFILIITFFPFASCTLITRQWLAQALRRHHSHRNFLLIADSKTAASFYQEYRNQGMLQDLKIYSPDRELAGQALLTKADLCFAGKLDQALNLFVQNSDGVIIGIPPSHLDLELAELLAYIHFRHVPVYTLESFYEIQWKQVPVQRINSWWAFARESLLVRDSIYDHVKRLYDFSAALVALLILGPLLIILGAVIRLDSPGPAIFRQTRIGRDGRPFMVLKFRTMRVGSDRSGSIYTAEKDSRITRLGRFLRRTRLDELPQLWNVLRGDMSLIGPRAEWIKCVEKYEDHIPFYNYRHFVRPGITGWAQVNYPYGASDVDALEKLKFDLYYIRNYSLSLDVAIVLKTLKIMLLAKGR